MKRSDEFIADSIAESFTWDKRDDWRRKEGIDDNGKDTERAVPFFV